MARGCFTFLSSACAWLLATRLGHAAGDDPGRAEALFQEARDAMKKGDYVAACPKFAASQRVAPALGTLLNLALCDEKLGLTATATLQFDQFLERAAADDERRALVVDHVAGLRPRAPRLILRLVGDAAGFRVALDGRSLSPEEMARPILLDPGLHALATSAPGGPWKEALIAVSDGQEEVRTLASPVPTSEPPASPPPREGASPTPRSRVPAYLFGGIGALGLLTGVVTGLLILDQRGIVENHCHGDLCDADGLKANDTGRALLVANTIAFGLGAVGVVGGAYLFLSASPAGASPPPRGGAAILPTRGPISLAVGLSGRF